MEIGWEVEVLKGAVKDPSPKISQAKALGSGGQLNLNRMKQGVGPLPRFLSDAGADARATMWDGRPRPSDCRKRLGKFRSGASRRIEPALITNPYSIQRNCMATAKDL
jgi:hypothetical protein